jgi:hypothetical protein
MFMFIFVLVLVRSSDLFGAPTLSAKSGRDGQLREKRPVREGIALGVPSGVIF